MLCISYSLIFMSVSALFIQMHGHSAVCFDNRGLASNYRIFCFFIRVSFANVYSTENNTNKKLNMNLNCFSFALFSCLLLISFSFTRGFSFTIHQKQLDDTAIDEFRFTQPCDCRSPKRTSNQKSASKQKPSVFFYRVCVFRQFSTFECEINLVAVRNSFVFHLKAIKR